MLLGPAPDLRRANSLVPRARSIATATAPPPPRARPIRAHAEPNASERRHRPHRSLITTDRLNVIMGADGAPDPDVFAIGDAATIEHSPLPATAQVANQQAKYVARRLNRLVRPWFFPSLAPSSTSSARASEEAEGHAASVPAPDAKTKGEAFEGAPFEFRNAGSLAYVGGWEAVFDRTRAARGPRGKETGRLAWLLWRSAYFTKTLSLRNKILVPVYW